MEATRIQELVLQLNRTSRDDLTAAKAELDRARQLVMDAVGGLTGTFYKLVEDSDAQRGLVHSLLATMDGANAGGGARTGIDAFIAETSEALRTLTAVLRDVSRNTEAGVRRTDPMLAQVDTVMKLLTQIDQITQQTRVLSVNARIEAAHASAAGAGFAVVASSMRDLARYCADLNQKITDQVSRTRDSLSDVRLTLTQVGQNGFGAASSAEQRTDRLLQQLESLRSSLESEISRLDQITQQVKANVADAVRALQFGDLVTQLLGSMEVRVVRLERTADAIQDALRGQNTEADLQSRVAEIQTHSMDASPVRQTSLTEGSVELF